jgi:hypothetical protein
VAGRRIVIEFLGDSKDLQNAMDGAESKGGKLMGTLGKVGKAAAYGLGAGLAIGAKGLYDATQAAGDLGETMSKTNAIFGKKSGDQLATWAGAAADNFGMSKQAALDAASTFGTFGKAAGKSGQDLQIFAMEQTALAADLASFNNTSPEEAVQALGAAFRGEAEPLRAYGVLLDDASMRQEAVRLGLIKTTKEALTPQQKVLAAQALIQKQTSDAQGDFARTSGSLANQQKILKAELANVSAEIGTKLLPAATTVATWFNNEGLPAAKAFGGWLQANLVPALGEIAGKVASVTGFLNEHRVALGAVAAAVGALVAVTQLHSAVMAMQAAGGLAAMIKGLPIVTSLTKVWTAVQWAANAALSANPIGLVIAALVALGAGLVLAWKHSETFRNVVTGALDKVRDVASSVANFFRSTLPQFFKDAWDGANQRTSDGVERIREWVAGLPGKLGNALSSLKANTAELFRDAMDAAKEKVTGIGATIISWIADIPGKLREKLESFKNAGAALIGGFVDGMKNAGGVIEGIAGNVWSAVKSLLNGAIDKINAALEFTISLPGPDLTVNPGNIPHLAKGGIVNSPTLALIGEDGPEAVVPLGAKNRPRGGIPGLGGGGSAPIIVQLVLPGGKVIEQLLIQHTRDTGRPLQVSTLGAG